MLAGEWRSGDQIQRRLDISDALVSSCNASNTFSGNSKKISSNLSYSANGAVLKRGREKKRYPPVPLSLFQYSAKYLDYRLDNVAVHPRIDKRGCHSIVKAAGSSYAVDVDVPDLK